MVIIFFIYNGFWGYVVARYKKNGKFGNNLNENSGILMPLFTDKYLLLNF